MTDEGAPQRARRTLLLGAGAAAGSLALGGCASADGWLHGVLGPPPVPREFRAAWIASVAHIDWPSRRGLTSAEQRAEMRRMVARAAAIGLNALVLQVRPSADALYPSTLEPWSEWLTGESGRAPDEAWDPLAEWVAEAHAHGLELHAWFNPYRARHSQATSAPGARHVANTQPAIVKRYGDQLWLDPAEPASADLLVAVTEDVVRRYDVDGVHIDDYFYPYPVNGADGKPVPFPDEPAWARDTARAAGVDRASWRRGHVDALVKRWFEATHRVKPWVRVGISPFGLPRPDRRPAGIAGFSQYDALYADVERWLEQGWLDYFVPQLYWHRSQAPQAFEPLLRTWQAGNAHARHLWPGLYTSGLGADRRPYDTAEVLAQIDLTRTPPRTDAGHVHFSIKALLENRLGIVDALAAGPYAEPALTPATPWLAEPAPQPPRARWGVDASGRPAVFAEHAGRAPLRHAVLWWREGPHWRWQAAPWPAAAGIAVPAGARDLRLVGIGRTGLESAARWVPAPAGTT